MIEFTWLIVKWLFVVLFWVCVAISVLSVVGHITIAVVKASRQE